MIRSFCNLQCVVIFISSVVINNSLLIGGLLGATIHCKFVNLLGAGLYQSLKHIPRCSVALLLRLSGDCSCIGSLLHILRRKCNKPLTRPRQGRDPKLQIFILYVCTQKLICYCGIRYTARHGEYFIFGKRVSKIIQCTEYGITLYFIPSQKLYTSLNKSGSSSDDSDIGIIINAVRGWPRLSDAVQIWK